ncbi:DUF202 domain-containing protein [Nocardia speluncae]|uniref:DUF202 domain-containing protein n=1 Tax=Nocardia speluncae TaxID=419477 RepID=A0A846XFJ0_9NOCA|nr:DUF202 domain-containing protein [Nocardia speluncae]NKY33383.1 DUF202 domain-containing protein [Nocardia speluncae]
MSPISRHEPAHVTPGPQVTRPATGRRWRPSALRAGTDPDPRFSLANERTFLAWIRTALGAVAAALALQALAGRTDAESTHRVTIVALLVFAVLLTAVALARWFRIEIAMRTGRPLPLPGVVLLMAVFAVVCAATVAAQTFI